MPASTTPLVDMCPYVGLRAFSESDAPLFYGRGRETTVVVSNARTARLTLLYAAAGVGKSSLVRAGVATALHKDSNQAVVVVDSWRDDPAQVLKAAATEEFERRGLARPTDLNLSVDDFFLNAGELNGKSVPGYKPPVVVLDQFDEYLLYGDNDDRRTVFESQLARAINRHDCPVRVLIVVREDALARLDRFSGRIPILFDNRLRIEALNSQAAVDAMKKPLDRFNQQHPGTEPVRIEDELVEAIIDSVQTGQQLALQSGRPQAHSATSARASGQIYIEASFLQLVLTTLWDAELGAGRRVLRATTLAALGGAHGIVRSYFESQMSKLSSDQREIAARMFRFLVSPSGTLNAFSADELADYGEVPRAEVMPLLERLASGDVRILRHIGSHSANSGPRYQVSFDVLAAAALNWRARYIALPRYSWVVLGPVLILLAVTVLAEVAFGAGFIRPGDLMLLPTRGTGLLILSCMMLVQIYRWFLRFVSMTGFLSVRTYRSPLPGLAMAVLLFGLCYVATGTKVQGQQSVPDRLWLASVSTTDFLEYVVIVLLTWAIGAVAFATMQFAGQLTARRYKSFDLGMYSAFLVVASALVVLIVVFALNGLPTFFNFTRLARP